MTDASPNGSRRLVLDKRVQIGTLIAIFVALCVGARDVYRDIQTQLYDLKMTDVTTLQKIEMLGVDVRLLREASTQTRADQKETDGVLRKTLESVAEDLRKIQLSLAGQRRSGLLRFFSPDAGDCRPDRGFAAGQGVAPTDAGP